MTNEKFILELATSSWAVVGQNGEITQSAMNDSTDGLSAICQNSEVIVLVPTEDVLLTSCQLPKMNSSKLKHAIPFALEDQLIDEVDALHFAYYQGRDQKETVVAVVAHDKMKQWLSTLSALNIKANQIIPRVLALPYTEDHISIDIRDGQKQSDLVTVRTGLYSGYACERESLPVYQTYQTNDVPKPTKEIHNKSTIADLALTLTASEHAINLNLLQGPYATKPAKLSAHRQLGKIAIGLAVSWVALLILYPLGSYFILKSHAEDLELQIAHIYKQQFPQAVSLVAPKMRMAEKLAKLKATHTQDQFLTLLAEISQAMADETNIKIRRLDFNNGQLNLKINATSSDDISNFTDKLNKQGLAVKQQNATVMGETMRASLQIE